ncbi:MAG: hypothetical protein JSS49_28160 [Planctomycetes bacterium]|nr:hypothetical protein [Planctomycetota bacterium]
MTADATVPHRVYYVPEALRENMGLARERLELTIRAFITDSVQKELPDIVEQLAAMGIEKSSDLRPVRWPIDQATLNTLAYAAEQTGIDQSKLLMACLHIASNRKRRRPTTAPKE